ncbi:response regulator transcription factor [Bacillus cereus group sp. Bc002]|uniref:LytR/AlgR family response regulator transcription factor n=1 Tax=Bacillus TaxID=1386 RepID=UPI000344B965|nr:MULTISPECIES: response regulator transcription factor [Bacillus cereus group]ASI80817.1 LytTR family transcriptional regulator [Bacillus cereus]MCC2417396.1 response regulator transcription factor [Bacillus pacificus]MCC2483001.1 response regulator transcription factor [Bacillus pacificus]MCU5006621.1 response regulator transcription factor [Bacillus pacificus]MCU5256934.1 response regulator transcription factor [Bacillus pacificus]
MSIFILEDDVIQAQQMKRLVEEICEKYRLPFDFIEVTSKSENIITNIPKAKYVPIYFLDIEIKREERKGLQVAQEIRKYDTQGIIVFVTTHSEFAPISYQYMVSALTFIDKGLPYEERYKVFEQCLLQYEARNKHIIPSDDFIVENSNATVRVPFHEVEYVMTDEPHRLALVTLGRIVYFYGALKEIEIIDERLFRCHQSYIVNTKQMSSYDTKQKMIVLKSGKRIPVSRRLVSKVRNMLKGEM